MKTLRRMLIIVVLLLLVGCAAVWYGLRHVLPYSAVRPYRITTSDIARRYSTLNLDSLYPFKKIHCSIPVRDRASLDAWFVPAENAVATVIVLHGIASSKEMILPRIARYHEQGLNVVAYDSRANGASGGDYCTLGFYEKYDVVDCINFMEQTMSVSGPWIIHGGSMGGAVALQAMAIEPRLRCGVVFCSFATLRETMADYMEQMVTLRWKWAADYVFRESERLARFTIDEVRPEESARHITQPVLLIHGEQDEKINVSYGKRIFANLGSTRKELVLVPGAGHLDVDKVGGDGLDAKIHAWVREVTQGTSGQ